LNLPDSEAGLFRNPDDKILFHADLAGEPVSLSNFALGEEILLRVREVT